MPAVTAWAYLPNAAHIDRVLAHVRAHPDRWAAACRAARDAAHGAAQDAARGAAHGATRAAAWAAAHGAARAAARYAAWDAIAALIAWDDCAGILDMPPEAVKFAALCGDSAAVLLLPAVLAMEGGA